MAALSPCFRFHLGLSSPGGLLLRSRGYRIQPSVLPSQYKATTGNKGTRQYSPPASPFSRLLKLFVPRLILGITALPWGFRVLNTEVGIETPRDDNLAGEKEPDCRAYSGIIRMFARDPRRHHV